MWPSVQVEAEALDEVVPEAVRELWDEARAVAPHSSRSAAALLRLALQTLLADLVPGESNLNAAIGAALRGGVPGPVQQAMDVLRVGGNGAVHPGELRLDDDPATLGALFGLLSYVVQETVVRSAQVSALFGRLPQGVRDGIERRDAKSHPPSATETP